jgi:tRNA A-37 threonylcarbamoyl transferase component Bud32
VDLNKEKALKIALSNAEQVKLQEKIEQIKKRIVLPALAKGNKTATNYDSRVTNYSTLTNIVTLADGRKLFVVYNYPYSQVHRSLDGFMKRLTGCRMEKANSREWKNRFESKSRLPVIPCEDENIVVMPFVSNINLYDLFVYKDDIKDFGECQFAETADVEGLLGIVDKIVVEVTDTHEKNITWGELILPNIIIDKEEKVHICDPETAYDKEVPIHEQKARDLSDLIVSVAAALDKYGIEHGQAVKRVLDSYNDKEVIAELKVLASKKPKFLEKVFFGYTKVRLGLKDKEQLQKIKEAIANYQIPE